MVGLGLIANRFAAVLSSLAGVELTAVAARDQSRAESFARRFSASQAFHNYLDVIANPGVDIVYVGLTHNFHYDIVKTCLQLQNLCIQVVPATCLDIHYKVIPSLLKMAHV